MWENASFYGRFAILIVTTITSSERFESGRLIRRTVIQIHHHEYDSHTLKLKLLFLFFFYLWFCLKMQSNQNDLSSRFLFYYRTECEYQSNENSVKLSSCLGVMLIVLECCRQPKYYVMHCISCEESDNDQERVTCGWIIDTGDDDALMQNTQTNAFAIKTP